MFLVGNRIKLPENSSNVRLFRKFFFQSWTQSDHDPSFPALTNFKCLSIKLRAAWFFFKGMENSGNDFPPDKNLNKIPCFFSRATNYRSTKV